MRRQARQWLARPATRRQAPHPATTHRHRMPQVVARVREPRFAPRVFRVTAFGAVGDGKTDCTAAIRRASGGRSFIVHVQNPQLSPSLFDLIVAPEHDRMAAAAYRSRRTASDTTTSPK